MKLKEAIKVFWNDHNVVFCKKQKENIKICYTPFRKNVATNICKSILTLMIKTFELIHIYTMNSKTLRMPYFLRNSNNGAQLKNIKYWKKNKPVCKSIQQMVDGERLAKNLAWKNILNIYSSFFARHVKNMFVCKIKNTVFSGFY